MRLTTGELKKTFYNDKLGHLSSLSNLGFRHLYHAFHPFDTAKLRHKKITTNEKR